MNVEMVRRILVVEDEVLVGMYLEDLLTGMGHHVVGPAARLSEAMKLAREENIDFAVLDMNLAGVQSYPVADILRQRGIPFVFATGYGGEGVAEEYRCESTLCKPYTSRELEEVVAKGLGIAVTSFEYAAAPTIT
jgi:CheY-like chemotaxis protein